MTFPSAGNGSMPHLAGEIFGSLAGVKMVHVPYKGSGQSMQDLLGGQHLVAFDTMPASAPHVRSGKLRALATSSSARLPAFADIPTAEEAGLAGYQVVAQDLTTQMGQAFLVENRPGANAIIATEFVARSAPDGYTMLFSSLSLLVNSILPGNTVKYDPFKDFAPVSNAAVLPMVVVTSPETKLNSMQELIARAKAKPGELSYGTSGHAGSTHLAGAMLELFTHTKMINVPFKGNGPALAEVMAGRVTFMFYPAVGIADLVGQKRLKVLAVGTAQPWADFPGVPTLEEMGLRGFDATAPWVGLLAPAGTPPAVVNRVSAEMRKSLAKPDTQARMKQLGAIIVADTPAEYAAFLKKDHERWAQVIKTSGVKAE